MQPVIEKGNTMKNMLSVVSLTTLLLMLTGCSGNSSLNDLSLSRLTSLINPVSQQQTQNSAEPTQRNYVGQFYGPIPIPAETVAMRLKQHYEFVSDEDVSAARNSGQGNAGWSASAISEGTSWEAQPGSYYRMSRNWAGNDRLTLEVRGTSKESFITATYISSNPEHLKKTWTSRLWKQIPDVAGGSLK
ncbi:Uncharacterised protein [Enterobacter cloacae]|jgi:hypothetical protein|nr:hypothetical protein AI2797V1_0471 [Enterobacter cloacae]CAE7790261.1 hypothetical protein AI2802V1_0470 [Enterobacter cloacae]CAH3498858.1 hypothetical protein AI2797V1_0471 [Enterobacter cloacae]CAH3842472.1 hypothetical protein AI2802V1_0470 [Enterobacter cloacae]SAD99967.1 Uncharacterised protein [Enterobacter cloacae]